MSFGWRGASGNNFVVVVITAVAGINDDGGFGFIDPGIPQPARHDLKMMIKVVEIQSAAGVLALWIW